MGVYVLLISYIWWLHFWFSPLWAVLLAMVIGSHLIRRESPTDLGFHVDNLRLVTAAYGPLVAAICGVALLAGFVFRSYRPASLSDILLVFGGYCVWGLFQQYILNGYFTNRVLESMGRSGRRMVPWIMAVLFAGVHTPNWFLMGVTFCAGYLCAKIYLEYGNLYFLGAAHGLVGTAIFFVTPDPISHHFMVGPAMYGH